MRRRTPFAFIWMALAGAWLCAGAALSGAASADGPAQGFRLFFPTLYESAPVSLRTITLLHINDFHGHLEADSRGRGGAAKLAGLLGQIRAEAGAQQVVLLDAGDIALGAPPISQLFLGQSSLDIYNRLQVAGTAFGNHEFDKGVAVAISQTQQANFPWLAANIVISGTAWQSPAWARPYVILPAGDPADGLALGVIGLTTTETPAITVRGATDGLEFRDPTEAVLRYYDEVQAQAGNVILLAHIGPDDSGPHKGTRRIAQELLDAGKPATLIIGGHEHSPTPVHLTVGPTHIVQAGYHGLWLGRTELLFANGRARFAAHRLISVSAGAPADAGIAARVDYWAAQVRPLIEQPVGLSAVRLTRDYNDESNLGNLVADGMRWKADAWDDGAVNGSVEIALTNPGGLRDDIEPPAGGTLPFTITWGATFNVLPFGNTLYVMDLTGAQLQELLDQSASLSKGMLQTSGLTWQWRNDCRCRTPARWGAEQAQAHGLPLEPAHVYRVVTNNFLAGGQDGWTPFAAGVNRADLYVDMQEGVNEYIRWLVATAGPLRYALEGRSVYLP